MKKLYFLNEEEKQRILNMHKGATKRNYLNEDRMLLNENIITKILDKITSVFRKRKTKISLAETKKLVNTIKTKLAVYIDGNDLLLLVKEPKLKGQEKIDAISELDREITRLIGTGQLDDLAHAQLLKNERTYISQDIDLFTVKKFDLNKMDENFWGNYFKTGDLPQELKDGIIIAKHDYKALDYPTQKIYYDPRTTKYKTLHVNPKESITKNPVNLINKYVSFDDLRVSAANAKTIRRLAWTGGLVSVFYLLGETIGYIIGNIGHGAIKIPFTTAYNVLKGIDNAVSSEERQKLKTNLDQYMAHLCNNETGEMSTNHEIIVEKINSFVGKKEWNSLKKYLEENFSDQSDILSFNRAFQDGCFWENLRNNFNDDNRFNKFVLKGLSKAIESTETKEKNLKIGNKIWERFSEVAQDKGFDSVEWNKKSIDGFNECPCIYDEWATNTKSELVFFKSENKNGYDILIRIGDYIYHPNCGKLVYKEFTNISNKLIRYMEEEDELDEKLKEMGNIAESDVLMRENEDKIVIGSKEWTEAYKKAEDEHNSLHKELSKKTIKCN